MYVVLRSYPDLRLRYRTSKALSHQLQPEFAAADRPYTSSLSSLAGPPFPAHPQVLVDKANLPQFCGSLVLMFGYQPRHCFTTPLIIRPLLKKSLTLTFPFFVFAHKRPRGSLNLFSALFVETNIFETVPNDNVVCFWCRACSVTRDLDVAQLCRCLINNNFIFHLSSF